VKRLIILLAFILPYSCYCQEKYLFYNVAFQQDLVLQKCGTQYPIKNKKFQYVIKLRYDKEQNKLFYAFYDAIYPPYEGKSLFTNMSKEIPATERDLNTKHLTIEQILSSPASADKMFSTNLSYQQQWNDGVSCSFMNPYEFGADNIPTLSFKKTK